MISCSTSSSYLGMFLWRVAIVAAGFISLGASDFGSNSSNVSIPDNGGWVSSTITISGAPAGATVTGIDVQFDIVHPYAGDLNVDLNADSQGNLGNYDLWEREGGSSDDPSRTVNGIATFNGLSVNRTWYLYARDEAPGDSGYIDSWWIRVHYDDTPLPPPPDLVSPGSSSAPGPSISTTTPTMRWRSVPEATGYGLYVSRNDSGNWTLIFDSENYYGGPISGTSRTLPGGLLEDGEAYRWNMRSFNSAGWGDEFSDRYYFTVSTLSPPPPPDLVSPGSSSAPGPSISTTAPTMQWSSVPGATGYGFYVSRNDSGAWTLVFDSEAYYGGPISGTSRTLPSGFLADGEAYRWNMRSYNSAGWGSDFSDRYYFTVFVPPTDTSFQWPVDNPNPISNSYSTQSAPGFHTGFDLTSLTGSTVVRAAAAGFARTIPLGTFSNGNHGMGRVIIIDHNDGMGPFTLYAHLATILVGNGDFVSKGSQIGVMGNSGTTGVHLHFEVKSWGVLGNVDDDLGPYWGYVPDHPNLFGYMNPWPFLDYEIPFLSAYPVVSVLDQIVRTGPDPTLYTSEVTSVGIAQLFAAFGEHAGWHQVFLASSDGPATGWIEAAPAPATLVQVDDPGRGTVGVNVRSGPTSGSGIVSHVWDKQWFVEEDQVPAGSGCSSAWSEIALGATSAASMGWVCGELLAGDVCLGDDATGDSDADGVCDDLDVCTGDDATGDSDADGVCDDLDPCPQLPPGHWDYCNQCGPCLAGEGDCEVGQCEPGLVCTQDVGADYGFAAYIDVCETGCPLPPGHWDYCNQCGPCAAGEGDCEVGQCAAGLTCVQDVGVDYGFAAHIDVCEAGCSLPPGHWDYCNQCGPCATGEGDCEVGQCAAGLVCVQDVGADYGFPAYIDVCEVGCSLPPGHWDYCTQCGPCAAGEGDCDVGQCDAGLTCVQDVGGNYGFPAHIDVCE